MTIRERILRMPQIEEVSDERFGMGRDGDPIFIYTAKGYAFEPHEDESAALHTQTEHTWKEAIARARTARPCSCARCK